MSTTKKSVRVCLLGASLSTGNMGVSALASGTVTSVLGNYPDGEVFLLDYGYEPATYQVQVEKGAASVELVNLRFSKKFFLRNNIARLLFTAVLARLLPESRWKRSLLERNPYLKRILEADIVASIAGGDSFSDIYGIGRLLYVALPQVLVLQLKKPLLLLPQTLGPFKGLVAKFLAGYIMRRARAVYSRDEASLREAEKLIGAQSKLQFSHDMAFVMKAVPPDAARLPQVLQKQRSAPLIGINVSGLLLIGGYTRDNMFGLKTDYGRLIRETIEYFVHEQNAEVLLVPHVFGNSPESDTKACEQIFQELAGQCAGRLHLLKSDFNQHEIKYVIGQCDFFLGARMHACIAALSQSVPAVCLAYSRKFAGVMASIGVTELVADLCVLDNPGALKVIRELFNGRTRIQSQLRKRMPEAQANVMKLFASKNSTGPGGSSLDRTTEEGHDSSALNKTKALTFEPENKV